MGGLPSTTLASMGKPSMPLCHHELTAEQTTTRLAVQGERKSTASRTPMSCTHLNASGLSPEWEQTPHPSLPGLACGASASPHAALSHPALCVDAAKQSRLHAFVLFQALDEHGKQVQASISGLRVQGQG